MNIETREDTTAEKVLTLAESLRWQTGRDFHEQLVESIYAEAARISDRVAIHRENAHKYDLDQTLDRLLTSRLWGFPIMFLLFTIVFWITITGANIPSAWLATLLLDHVYGWLKAGSHVIGLPWWLDGVLIDGMYLATAWVVSVMLPPMAIFFPLFTLLEDFGYLPRVAFNLDSLFRRAGAHGKQSLSMMMGFGCNAAGVIAARVIDSPRERLIAIITNNFALCNGRWPTLILLATVFVGALAPDGLGGVVAALAVVGVTLLGVFLTFLVSWSLSRTILKGELSTFSLELPSYRPPRFWQTIYTSLIDRTLYVLRRAVVFALPAGAIIWIIANLQIHGLSLAEHMIDFLNPFGVLIGLNGVVLLAYIVAIPANEIIIPAILMLTVLATGLHGAGTGVLFETNSTTELMKIFTAGGWTLLTAINLMIFSLVHNPCSTTIYTIYKETKSLKWTTVATLLPVVMGLVITFVVAQVWRLVAG